MHSLSSMNYEPFFQSRFYRSPAPEAIVGSSGALEFVNDAFCALVGHDCDELVGQRLADVTHASDDGDADAALARLLSGGAESCSVGRILQHLGGRPLPVLVNMSSVRDNDGRVVGASGVLQDLTVLRDTEQRLAQQLQLFDALGNNARDAAILVDATGRMIYVSPAVETLFGYDRDDLVGLDGFDFIHDDDVAVVRQLFTQLVKAGGTRSSTFRVRVVDGSWRWVEETLTNLLDTPIGGVVCNLVDATDSRAAQAALELSEARHRTVVETAQEGVWIISPRAGTDYINPAMAQILGLPLEVAYQQSPGDLVVGEEAERLRRGMSERSLRGHEVYELLYPHPDGSERTLLVSAAPIAFGGGAFAGSLAMVTDVTIARRAEAELRDAALHDALTGLPNRLLLMDRLEHAILTAEPDEPVAVILVDIDRFKIVNGVRGHDFGDQTLTAVAARLTQIAGAHDTVARLGGDEFLIVAAGSLAETLGARIAESFAVPVPVGDNRVQLSVSVGVAITPPNDIHRLLREVDAAKFAAKAAGGAQVRVFDRELSAKALERATLMTELAAALHDDALEMHYQPIVALATGAVHGFEALARWTHPRFGPIAPDTFVALAEEGGLARELDRWAIRRALTDFSALRTTDAVARDATVAVNLSARHIGDADLERELVTATYAAGLYPRDVVLEVTERSVIPNLEAAKAMMGRLRDCGFTISLDDFATGYSSLAYLRDFSAGIVKIDRSFVADLTTDHDALAIVTAIIKLARAVGARTVAEGVETSAQATQLRQLGCEAAQGWLWSRAVSPQQITDVPRSYAPTPTGPGDAAPRQRKFPVREEHGLVRLLDLQRQGASLATVSAALNSEGYAAPDGRRWHKMSVARALSALAGTVSDTA